MTLDDDVAQLLARIGLRPDDLPAHLVDLVRQHLDPRPKEPSVTETLSLPEIAAQYQRAINSAVAGIAADPHRTGYDKVRAAAQVWAQQTRRFETVRAAHAAAPRSELAELVQEHFGYPRRIINSTARELAEMNASKAHTDAAAVPVQNISAELDKAIALGADSLARALARRAYDHRQADALNRYLSAFPAEDAGVTKAWDLRQQIERDEKLTGVVELHMATKLSKPPLIADFSDYELERFAAQAVPTTTLDPALDEQIIASTMGTWRPPPTTGGTAA